MKKTWKRWSALLLAVVMTLSLFPTAALAARVNDDEVAIDAPDAAQAAQTAGLPGGAEDGPAALMADEGPTNAADSRYDISLTADMLSTKSTRYEDWATRLLDNDASTSWEASYENGNAGNINYPTFAEAALEVNFTQATSVLGFRYQTKGDTNGAFVQWKIETKATQDGEWTEAKSSDETTKWASHTGGGWQMAKLDAAAEVWGIRLVPQSFKNGAAADAAEQAEDNTDHVGGKNSENMSCAGLRVFGATKAPVEYNATNIDAGMFDVGFDDATGVYSNPLNNGVATEGTVIRAWASSQEGGASAAYNVADGDESTMWHSRWNGTSDTAIEDSSQTTAGGYGETLLAADPEKRWIELDIMNGTSFGTPVLLNGLRYNGRSGANGRVNKCAVRVSATESGDDWVTVTSGTDWTRGSGTGWSYKQFDYPVLARRVRLYGVETTNSNKNMTAIEIRLVKAESQSTDTRNFTITVKDKDSTPVTGATVTCGGKTATEGDSGTYTVDLYDGDYIVTVAKDGFKTRTVSAKVSESSTSAEVTLYAPLSNADVTAHKWDYPLWADVNYAESGTPHRYTLSQIYGGSVDAYSYTYHATNADLPAWAAVDGNNTTLWHSNYQSNDGDKAGTTENGKWYEFTLGQKTSIIGLWYMPRSSALNQPGNVTIKVSGADDAPTEAEWSALPVVGSGNMTGTAAQEWVFVELPAPVEAKRVRFYSASGGHVVVAEARVVMDPETSGAKQLTGTVRSSADGNAAIPGATLTVANHSATSGDGGVFDLGYLPAGQTYTITASAPGYAAKTVENVTISDTNNVPILLTPQTRSLTVTVANNLAGATVALEDNTDSSNLPVSGVASATTNSSGVATLDVTYVTAGTYKLRVSHPDYDVKVATVTIPSTGDATASVEALTARTKADHDLVETYDFSSADQVNDFQPIVSVGGATVAWDEEKQAMKITFVDDATSYKNLVINKKYMMEKGWLEFDVTPDGTVNADAAIGAAVRYSGTNNAWLHVGQLGTVLNSYAAAFHTSATEFTNWNSNVTTDYVAMGNGATRRFGLQVKAAGNDYRTELTVDGTLGGWKANHNGNYVITNDEGLWGFDAKNANGLVVYIDNVKLYRPTADKSAVTIGTLSDGTLSTKIVTELDATGTDLTSGNNAYAGDTVKISAAGIPENKVFAVTVTKTGDPNTVVTTTKESDGSFTFTMPAYPVTITPAAATGLTSADVTVTGTTAGSGNQIDGTPFPEKYVRVGNTLTVTPATGVTYQWQYSSNGTDWANISGATGASFELTTAQYNSENSKNQVRVQVTGDNVNYAGTVESAAVDVLAALKEVSQVTFNRNAITMTYTSENDVDSTANNATEGKTTVVTALIGPSDVSRPMTVTWKVTDKDGHEFEEGSEVIALSNESTQATVQGENLIVTATVTAKKAGTAKINVTATAKDGTTPVTSTTGITVTVLAETSSVTVYKAEGNEGTEASTTEVTEENPLVLYTNSDADLTTLNGQTDAPQRYNKFRLFADPTPADATDVADWQWVRQDQSLTGLIRAENTDNNNATRLIYAQGSAEAGYTEQNVGERTVLVKKTGDNGPTYATFRVVVLRHLVKNVTVSPTGEGVTQARPGVTLEAVTSALNISDAGVAGLTYEWYRKAAATEENSDPTAVKIENQSGKTYTLTNDDIGCEITVKVIATPKYGTDVDADKRYYYEGERTSTNAITVGKNAGPEAPELSSTAYDGTNAQSPTMGTIVITGPVAGETYEIRKKTSDTPETWGDWANATLTGASSNTIENLDAGDYQVRIKENDLHDVGTAKAVTVQDSSQTYHAVTVTVTTQDFQGKDSNTLEGGKAVRSSDSVVAGQSATLTVTPAEGFDILTVKNGETELTGTDGENGAKVYTVSNVNAPVAFAVTFKQKSVTISHNFTNLVCSLGDQSTNTHTVAYGSTPTITVSLAQGVDPNAYELPERGASTSSVKKDDGTNFTGYSYEQATGTFTITEALKENITITASAKAKSYSVSFTNMSNVSGPSGTQTATYGTDYTAHLTASSGYSLPDEVTVTVGGTTLTKGENTYSYDKSTGDVVIKGAAITGNITISATGVKNTTPVTGVTIVITHTHTAAGDSGATEEGTPHVGDSLRADAAPAGATVTYQWYSKGASDTQAQVISGATSQSYVVVAGDKDKVITVKVTGTGDYSSEATSTALPAVKDPTIAATGVTLDKTTTSIVFGATDTLTATVEPENATNQTVTWKTSNANVATVANGVVTATGVGTATITVRTANGREATCTVTVTQKDLTNDDTATVRVGGTLELGQEVTANLVPADAAAGATYAWYIVDAATGNTVLHTIVDSGKSVTLPTDSDYLGAKVKVVVSYNGNYTGTKTRITEGTITGQGQTPSHSVVIASGIENGSVTADKTTAQEGETVTLTVTPGTGYELDALTVTGYHNEAVQITKENDTTYTFTMPRNLQTGDVVNVTATFRVATVTPTTYAITTAVEPANSGRVQLTVEGTEVTSAEEGATVYVAANPNGDYVLSTITAKDADDQAVTVTNEGSNYYFTMPAKAVTVTATFTTGSVTPPEVDKAELEAAIAAANAAKKDVVISDKEPDAVEEGVEYYTQAAVDTLTEAVKTAEAVLNKANATQDEVDEAVTTLNEAVTAFGDTKRTGTMDDAELVAAIEAARNAKAAVYTINDEPANVKEGIQFVTTDEMKALNDAIDTAQEALNDPDKTQTTLNEAKDALAAAKVIFDDAIKTGTSKTAEAPVVDTTALDEAIAAAEAAKKNVVIKDADTDPATVNRGTKFVTQEVMDALDAAIAAAEEAKADKNKTDGSVSNAVDALNAAVKDFNAATKTGTKSTSSSSSNRPSNNVTTETKEDGTKVTTETKSDGTTIVTTETPDGAKEVVETKKDGTVTETKTDAEGAKTEKVTTPEKDVTITVTDKDGEELAKVELPAEIPALETRFEDVPEGHWADQAIHHAASLKLVEGVGDNKFDMVSDMTRGALAAVLYRLSQGKTDYETTFKDVAEGQYYTEGVAWAAKVNVVTGYTEDTFAPEDTITREQLAVMLCRYAKLVGMDTTADAKALDKFADGENTGAWAVDGMAWCVANGILQGKGGSVLDPTASVSRAEVATMLDRFIALMK